MEPKNFEIIKPEPFFNIVFGCSNRAFYSVKNELFKIANLVGIEINDGYITEECDYEGDLERIIVYREERSEEFVKAILKHYKIEKEIPSSMNVVLSIF